MFDNLRFFPDQASTFAADVDLYYFALIAICGFFLLLIVALLTIFGIKYHWRRSPKATQIHGNLKLEMLWTLIPTAISLGLFVWAALLFFRLMTPPPDCTEYFVTGKQWMWKIQHPTGQREINTLTVPVNTNIKLTMTSEDVLHSFFIPDFRTKNDVVPGKYSQLWFNATKAGDYRLFCAEYCGTEHSRMIGWVHVLEEADYLAWLEKTAAGDTPVAAGKRLFERMQCNVCHEATDTERGPSLAGRYGQMVDLEDGRQVLFDHEYIRESIREPARKVSKGFPKDAMSTYKGQLDEDQILQLVSYIRSLTAATAAASGGADDDAGGSGGSGSEEGSDQP